MIKLQLHENWQLCNIRQLDWIPAQIPGDIYAALLKTGKMPDPFFGDNEYPVSYTHLDVYKRQSQ